MTAQQIARLVVVWSVLLLPVAAWAQSSGSGIIAGVVRDTTGAVMPGVTVEAASLALIEKVRTSVTDGQGLYRIVDLRPGLYTVTFTLLGFSTFKREGLELTGGFTATVNADLRVGTLEETITVSGETPVVDIQNILQQTTVRRSTLDALPTTGRIPHLVSIIPGAVLGNAGTHSVGGLDERPQYGIHGSRSTDNAPTQDGMNQRLQGGAIFVFNNLTFQEVVVETSGMSADRPTGGVQITMVPKDGGNTFSGSFRTSHTGPSLASQNLTDELRARGLSRTPSVKKHYDTGGALGGPIKRDRLWFFTTHRRAVNQQYQQGNHFNKLQGTLFYEPDLDRVAYTDDYYRDYALRLTWQAGAKHKIVASYQVQPNCSCFWPLLEPQTVGALGVVLAAPEAVGRHNYLTNYLPLLTWTFPATNRLLFEAGASANVFNNHTKRQTGVGTDTIGVIELSGIGLTPGNFRYGSRAIGLTHAGGYRIQHNRQYHQRVAVSYVTGSHAFKTGLDLNEYREGLPDRANDPNQINQARSYSFRSGVPNQVTIWAVPFESQQRARDIAVYAQHQWTIRRLTLNPGLRYNNFNASVPEQHMPAGPWVPARDFPAVKNAPNYHNLNVRLGAAYDLFGTGRTAIKVALGRYTPYSTSAVDNPATNAAASATRIWDDRLFGPGDPRTGNYIPDCVLGTSVPGANGECGALSNAAFGLPRVSETHRAADALEGFNRQFYNWQSSISVQHELRPNVALNVGYFRTWYGGFLVRDNQFVTPVDYDPYCITGPRDTRLPGGGNQVCGLYDLKPEKFGLVDNLVTLASHYGRQTEIFNGIDVTLNARFGRGAQFQGGLSMGRTVTDNCFVVDSPQTIISDVATVIRDARPGYCHVSQPWGSATQVKFLVVYPLPWNLQTSMIYQNIPGIPIAASYVATNAEIRPSLGRHLSNCPSQTAATCNATAAPFDLITPNTLFEDRLQQVDLRFARIFRMREVRLRGNFDVYNLFNASSILNMTTRFGNRWLDVAQIMGGRLFKISAQFDF